MTSDYVSPVTPTSPTRYDGSAADTATKKCPLCKKQVNGDMSFISPSAGRLRYCKNCMILFPIKSPLNRRTVKSQDCIPISPSERDFYEKELV